MYVCLLLTINPCHSLTPTYSAYVTSNSWQTLLEILVRHRLPFVAESSCNA